MKKLLLFTFLISCVVAQPRKAVQWRDLQEAIKDSIRNSAGSIGDSMTVLRGEIGDTANVYIADSLNNITLYNGLDNSVYGSARKIGQKIIANTTTLAAYTADSNGTVIYLQSPPGYYAQIDSAYPEQGGIFYNNSTNGKQWGNIDFLRTNQINVKDFSVLPSNSAATNNTAMQNVFDFINALSADSVSIYIPDGRYLFSTTFTINRTATSASNLSILIQGGSETRLVQTANDTLFLTSGLHYQIRLKDLYFVGTGKANTSVGLASPATAVDLYLESCAFDSFGVAIYENDLTSCYAQRLRLRQNGVGVEANFNVDGWIFEGSSSSNDTTFLITGSSDDYVKFLNWTSGLDSVWLKFSGTGGFHIDGGYFENVRHQGLIGSDDGNTANGIRNIVISSTFQIGSAESGFTFYDNDIVTIYGTKVTGNCDTSYFNFNTNSARVTTFGNYFSGTNLDIRYASDDVKFTSHLESVQEGSRSLRRYNVNGLGETNAVDHMEVFSVTDTAYTMKRGVTGASNRTFSRYMYQLEAPTFTTFGMSGTGYWDFDGGASGAPATISSVYRGHLYYREQSIDEPYLGIQFGTGIYKWINLLNQGFSDEGDMAGNNTFTTSALHDTVLVSGVHPDSDYVFLTPVTSSPDTSAILSYTIPNADTIIVHRQSGVISGLPYVWRRFKKFLK